MAVTSNTAPSSSWRLRLAAIGPAFVAAIAYVDPGNVATNVTAGSQHGFLLLWVVILATLMAAPVQYLSAKLGITTGMSLPEHIAARRGRGIRLGYWAQAELVAIATDIAEIVGACVALNLLFGIPLVPAGLLVAALSLAILATRERLGERAFEIFSVVSLVAIGTGFVIGLTTNPPAMTDLAGGLIPRLHGSDTVLLAAGIVGATIMPHAIYLHSGLTAREAGSTQPHALLRWTRVDVTAAMILAGSINVCMLVLGATALRGDGSDSIESSASHLATRAGHGAELAFLIALLVSGLSSTAVGTQAGSVIMSGLLKRRLQPVVRRGITLLPCLLLLGSGLEPMRMLILSQVGLSLGLPFALIPLVILTSGHATPKGLRNGFGMKVVAWTVAVIVCVLDVALIVLQFA